MKNVCCLTAFGALLACSSPPKAEKAPLSTPVSVPMTTSAPAPEAKLTTAPTKPAPQLKADCVGGPYSLNMLLSKNTCPIGEGDAVAVAPDALTFTTDPSPLKVKSGGTATFQVSLTNNTKQDINLELALHCREQHDEIFLRAMKPGTEEFADLEKQPASPGCGVSWGCSKKERDARISLTPGKDARMELTYTAVFMQSHCDPGPATKKPLPPGTYELAVHLPIPVEDGGNLVGKVPLVVTK